MEFDRVDENSFNILYDLVSECVWLRRKKTELISLWNLCDTDEQRSLLLELLERFKVLTTSDIGDYGEDIAKFVINNWNFSTTNSYIVAISDGSVDGSQGLLQFIKNKFSNHLWKEDNFISTIGQGAHKLKNDMNIVLFDDFIGTGETIDRKYSWMSKKIISGGFTNVTLKVVAVACMNNASNYLSSQGISFYSPLILKRGISDYCKTAEIIQYKQRMYKLEEKLEEIFTIGKRSYELKYYSLGYNQSEALYAIEDMNLPDNVFPIFWWPLLRGGNRHNSIFTRLFNGS